jgi:hypothetical protein
LFGLFAAKVLHLTLNELTVAQVAANTVVALLVRTRTQPVRADGTPIAPRRRG